MFSLQLFYVMGLPSVVTTDQGKEFHNKVNSELINVFGIKHRMTTAYHPQANGLDERLHQTLINSLSKFIQDDRESSDVHILEVVYAYNNTAYQESTKHTPFETIFSRQGRSFMSMGHSLLNNKFKLGLLPIDLMLMEITMLI